MSKEKLIPEFRFPEFKGEWSLEELGQCLDYLQPTPFLVDNTDYNDEYEIPVLTAGKSFILGYTNEQEGIFNENLPVIIFDDFTTASQFVDFPFKTKSSAMKILLAKNDNDIKFVYESMQTLNYEVGVHKRHWISVFSKLRIAVPKPQEQQKIASCLSSLDELIAAHKDKLDALKDHKKGLLQNLFPQEGETVPKVRFPEFEDDGEWVENELGKICDVRDGTHDSPKYVSDGYPLITSKNLLENGAMDFENVSYLTQEDYDKINQRSKVDVGDILFGMIGTIGNPVIVKRDGFAIKNVALIKTKGLLEQEYLIQLLKSNYIDIQFQKANAGGILKFIALGMIRKLIIPTPKKEEQQKIASCLSAVDELISAQQEKIDELQQHKKGLMQGLFPKIES